MRFAGCAALVAALWGQWCAPGAQAEPSTAPPAVRSPALHQRIDALIQSAAVGPLAPACDDADFVRRVYLDLTGVIPTADEARAFVADRSPDKRQRLIDELLASPAFNRHLTITLDFMLMERKAEKTVKQPEWETYLYRSLAEDKPLDRLFRELLSADGADEALRPAAKFVLDRDAEPNLVTRDVGRIAFGMDLQCCQCHDHPLIDDYYQDDYYGLFAFVHRTSLFTDAKTKLVSLTEKADGEASFKSVFTGAANDKARPRLPKGPTLLVEPTFAKDQEYKVKPDKTVRGVPKFSRRAALAEMIPGSREFARNLANRLWAHMLGRGLVHPLDFHYAGNPPSNPRVLTLLAEELAAGGFKLRPMLREIALTQTYQRSCDAPRPEIVNLADVAARLAQLKREKEAQQQSIPQQQETLAKAKTEFKAVQDEEARLAAEMAKLEKTLADARAAKDKAASRLGEVAAARAKVQTQAQAVNEAASKLAAAIAALPDDQDLASAQERVRQVAHDLAAAAKAADGAFGEREREQQTLAKQVSAAEAAIATATAARPSIEHKRQLETAQLDAEDRLADANYMAKAIDSQIALAQAILDQAELAKDDAVKAEAAWNTLVERWTIAGQVAPLRPLTPEQLAASVMQATGVLQPTLASAQAKVEKTPPELLKKAAEKERLILQPMAVQLELLTQLRGTFGEFVRQYGGAPGSEFQATANQALFFGNGTIPDNWLKPGANLVNRLVKVEPAERLVDELSWAVYSRPATDAERQAAAGYIKDRSDRAVAIGEMAWALLSSTEFRFSR